MRQLLFSDSPHRRRLTASSQGLRALASTLVVLATACGGESAGGNEAASEGPLERIDACALLTPAEVGGVLGTTVSEPNKREASAGNSLATICIYDGGWPNSVNLTVRQSKNAGQAGTSTELTAELNQDLDDMAADTSMADLVEGGRWEALELTGHAAAIRDAGEGGWTTAVRKDGMRRVEVLINAPTRDAGVALAGMVMERLKQEG